MEIRREMGNAAHRPAAGAAGRVPAAREHRRSWMHTLAVRLALFNRRGMCRGMGHALVRTLSPAVLVACAALAGGDEVPRSAETEAKAARTLLVLGDSLSAGYGFPLERGWVNLLRQRLQAEHPGAYRVVNASASGDTTAGGLARLALLLAEHRPHIVCIELGGNDGMRGLPVDTIRANLLTMTEAAQAAGATPVLLGMRIHPNYGPRYTEAFHAAYAEVAEATGATLVPFLLEGVATNPKLMQRDGIHPNAEAQETLLENVWETLAPLLR